MLSIITNLFRKTPPNTAFQNSVGPTVLPIFNSNANLKIMSLDDRKAWRLEMMHRSLRDTFMSVEVIGAMYKHRITVLDARGHQFAIMIDITKDFAISKNVYLNGFAELEELIITNAFTTYGLSVKGVYWRTNDLVNIFERERVSVRRVDPVEARKKLEKDFSDTLPSFDIPDTRREPRRQFDPITPDEQAAFKAALQSGTKPPKLHIGDKEYDTDIAPLGKF